MYRLVVARSSRPENERFEITGPAQQYMHFAAAIHRTKWLEAEARKHFRLMCVRAQEPMPSNTHPVGGIKAMRKKMSSLTFMLITTVFSSGCDMTNEKSSNDIAALRNLVETDLAPRSVHWEVFGSPEYTGGVPGPTDYFVLVAEVEPDDHDRLQTRPRVGKVVIVREAARPWLTEGFRAMLAKHKDSVIDVSIMPDCRKFEAIVKKTAEPVEGFICSDRGKSLIYLILSDRTAKF
jgi:hypothetical protein